jgi:hypothetical protein
MLLPLPHRWPVHCARCGHKGQINAAVADLARKMLVCGACGHRQPFAPETVVRSSRHENGRRARRHSRPVPRPVATGADLLNDRLDDLWAAR